MKKGSFRAGASVHDPAIFLGENGEYYIFGTHMTAAKSTDLRHWECFCKGVNEENPLFRGLFEGEKNAFSYTGKFNGKHYAVWAPDVSYNPYLKKYVMYFCSTASYVKSAICMAVADHVEGPYEYADTLLYSGFDRETAKETNLASVFGDGAGDRCSKYLKKNGKYNNLAWPNCIDPNVFHDKDGRLWMVYGSWSGGIFLLEIDEKTGYPIRPKEDKKNRTDSYFGKKILGGGHKSIEGPYILYDEVADYYYLFVSYGWLGRDGGYQIRVFRSKNPDGPYVDMNEKQMFRVPNHAPFGLKLMGNYTFPGLETGYKAPGHNSAFRDRDGKLYLVHHQRFDCGHEFYEPRVHQLFRTIDGWLTACPFAANGEERWSKEACAKGKTFDGIYFLVDHGLDISGEMHLPIEMGLIQGVNFQIGNDGSAVIDMDGRIYYGAVCCMTDEAGNPVTCFSGVCENQSIWAVRCEKTEETPEQTF